MSLPARQYKWPPFQPGHRLSTRHGVWSRRVWQPLAADFAAALLGDRPELSAYPETVAAWARAEARCVLFAEYLSDLVFDREGEPHPALRFVNQFERQAAQLREQLGLTPSSEAALIKMRAEARAATAVDLVARMAAAARTPAHGDMPAAPEPAALPAGRPDLEERGA